MNKFSQIFSILIVIYSIQCIEYAIADKYSNWQCRSNLKVWNCPGNKRCGDIYESCIDIPNEPINTNGIIILVVTGVLTLIIIIGIIVSCYYRRRQAKRRLFLSTSFLFQKQWQPTVQPMENLDCRIFNVRNMPPTYQQATETRQ